MEKQNPDHYFMELALKEAKKALAENEIPVGAVIVDEQGDIVAKARNQREKSQDLFGHAEIIALKKAAKKLNNWRMEKLKIYVTLEPCPMCAGALWLARMGEVIFGAYDLKYGAAGSAVNLADYPGLGSNTLVRGGVLKENCEQLLKDFFTNIRNY